MALFVRSELRVIYRVRFSCAPLPIKKHLYGKRPASEDSAVLLHSAMAGTKTPLGAVVSNKALVPPRLPKMKPKDVIAAAMRATAVQKLVFIYI